MNNDNRLQEALLDRAVPMAPSGLPAPPPAKDARVPPAWKRYQTGLKMQDAVANGWTPHPTLVKVLEGK